MTKRYTVAEANALLPHLAPALIELKNKYELAREVRARMDEASMTNGGSRHRERWQRTLARVDELEDRLASWGVVLRDVEEGIVDLPGTMEGRDVFLCWKLGEEEVGHWHPLDEGYGGRRKIPPGAS